MPVRKRRQKDLRVSDFSLLLVVFKRHRASEWVNATALVVKACVVVFVVRIERCTVVMSAVSVP